MGRIITLENIAGTYHVNTPPEPQFESEILFAGNKICDQYWVSPPKPKFKNRAQENSWMEKEFIKYYVDGQWVAINGILHWLPPNYYFFLQEYKIKGKLPDFRMKKLKHTLFKQMVRDDLRYTGTLTVKNRRDGETHNAMSDIIWEALPADFSYFGIQSTDLESVKRVCWTYLMAAYKRINPLLKLNSDGTPISDGKTDATKLIFRKPKKKVTYESLFDEQDEYGLDAQETEIFFTSSGTDSFDGSEMRRIAMDEWLKWIDTDPLQALSTYRDCVMMGTRRVGVLDIFSSPVEKKSKYTEDLYDFWKRCDPSKPNADTGICETGIARWFSNPLEGIESFYDKYGEGMSEQIDKHITRKRNAVPKHLRQAEVRKYPRNEAEAFGAYDATVQWSNHDGMDARRIYLTGTNYKNEAKKELKYIYGSLHWENHVPDTRVFFKPDYEAETFCKKNRFCFAFQPPEMETLRDMRKPPRLFESVIGVDPYDYRNPSGKKVSNGAGVQFRFLDFRGIGRIRSLDSMYLGRPSPEVFYEDMIMYCIYTQSMCQVEDKNRKIIDYFEDRGYEHWLLPKDMWGDPAKKGNSPNGQTGFMDGVFSLVDAYFSEPMNEDDLYNLENVWLDQILADVLIFNREDTHLNDISMALGQALFGAQKWLARHKKRIPASREFADALADCLF